jgi:hypothetical protein
VSHSVQQAEKTVFIIGGGPSVGELILDNPKKLSGRNIIVTNNAYKIYPDAQLCHFADNVWWKWHQKPEHNIKTTFHGVITTCTNQRHLYANDNRVKIYKPAGDKDGLSLDPGMLCGTNSGHQAINLAYHLGYNEVVLIGFDCNERAAKTHFHHEHERITRTTRFKDIFIPGFEKIQNRVDNEGLSFKIFNVYEKSAIRCFEFSELERFLH